MADLERVRRTEAEYTSTGTTTADGLINFQVNGKSTPYIPLQNTDWERIVVDSDIHTLAIGTSTAVTLDVKLKTVNDPNGTTPIAATTMNATLPNGTAAAMTQVTVTAAREVKGFGRSGGAGLCNLGSYLAIYHDVAGTSPSYTHKTVVRLTK